MYDEIPTNLVFDDDNLDGVLYGLRVERPTPADVLDASRDLTALPTAWHPALLAILKCDPGKGRLLQPAALSSLLDQQAQMVASGQPASPRDLWNLARLYQSAHRLAQAEARFREVLNAPPGPEALTPEERDQVLSQLIDLLLKDGRDSEAEQERALRQAELRLAAATADDLLQVRVQAMEFYLAGRHDAAERLYRELLARHFQEGSIWVHLARVLIMQDRWPEARTALAQARKCLGQMDPADDSQHYIRLRTCFLAILLAMLAGRPYAELVAAFRRQLERHPQQEPWTIDPVLHHVKPRLSGEDGARLALMAAAIHDPDQRDRLAACQGLWPARTSGCPGQEIGLHLRSPGDKIRPDHNSGAGNEQE